MIEATAFFKCLSDPTRLKILLLLIQYGRLCVCELHESLDEEQSKVSRHLSGLRLCDLLIAEKQGKWVYYQLNPDLPDWVRAILQITRRECQQKAPDFIPSLSAQTTRPT